MTKRGLSYFLQDILDSIEELESFTSDVSFEDFSLNREKILAVVKLLEILGEAVKQIPVENRDRYPDINWKGIAGMRDILVHQYWGVDLEVIWLALKVMTGSNI